MDRREYALGWTFDRLDVYGECRNNEQERSGCELLAWVILARAMHGQDGKWTDESLISGLRIRKKRKPCPGECPDRAYASGRNVSPNLENSLAGLTHLAQT